MKLFVSAGFLACCTLALQPAAHANVVETTPVLPPTVGVYALPTICKVGPGGASACAVNATISNFNFPPASVSFAGGNENEDGTATFSVDFYTDVNGSPGTLLKSLSVPATIGFEFFGRSGPNDLGTFQGEVTEFTTSGTIGVHTFQAMLNPNIAPIPTPTTITAPRPDGPYTISSFFDVFPELSIDGGPFVPGPERTVVLQPSSTPEPSSVLLLLSAAGAIAWIRRAACPKSRS